MARIRPLEPEEFSPEYRESLGPYATADKAQLGVMRIWAQRPDLAIPYRRFIGEVLARSVISKRLIELIRIRVAFHNQCRSCMAIRYRTGVEAGVTDDLVCELASPEEAPDLSDGERAALHYADLMATNHLAISNATFDRLREHFSEPEIVELGMHIAYCIGFGRLAMSWDMVDDLPERFRERGTTITPWGADTLVV